MMSGRLRAKMLSCKPQFLCYFAVTVLYLLATAGPVWSQTLDNLVESLVEGEYTSRSGHAASEVSQNTESGNSGQCFQNCFESCEPGLFAGADFLFLRAHFSEAIAFARGTQSATSVEMSGRELQFDYDGSFRVFGGFRTAGGGETSFTYWHFRGDTSVNGSVAGPGEFLIDPFGNNVGTYVIIDPSDARGLGTPVVGGDLIRTKAIVETNVYDLEYKKSIRLKDSCWTVAWSAGVRLADIEQFYESLISNNGVFLSGGDFSVDFIGAGPRLGIGAERSFGDQKQFTVFAKSNGSLLVGDYNGNFSQTVTVPATFVARQSESLTRTIPVFETELGTSWKVNDSLTLSAGWMFQAWFDFGTSGGQFGGFFLGADDSNIMSFDGLTARAELVF